MNETIEVKIRRATEADVTKIAAINAKVFLGNRDNQQAAEQWINCWFSAFPLYQYFVAEIGAEIAGYIGWQIHGGFLRPEPVVELEQIGIDPDFQGRGIGPKLEDTIHDVVEWIKQANSRIESNIYVSVWGYALNFNAMSIYAKKFTEGVQGLRKMYGERAENMLRWRIPMIRPIRRDE
ncbi:MAG: GNAT family N-acetyltransferase [bacterium]|nr:GNAT family N-acetyltransferase [bacterium]